ncbi:MAG: aldo/keto reductase [Elusimicrobiota bacterium]|jgi:aryl-alcohol dehydrogenase-like predicted oxidoreductase
MMTRTLGRTGISVSEIGFGAWGIGKTWWGPASATDDQESLTALRRALELGITFFDTAYVYGDGHSETLISRALPKKGPCPFVATKCPPKNHEWPAGSTTPLKDAFPADWIIQCTERSLRKLKVETLDLQQFHVWTDAWCDEPEWREAVERLKREGKIRFFGVSINDCQPESALRLVASGAVDTVQVIYNIFEQEPSRDLFPLCQKMNVGVIVRVPFDEGSLTGMLALETRFDPEDFRSRYFGGEKLQETIRRVEALKPFLGSSAPALPPLALKFTLSHPAVSVVIPGMRRLRHVEENVRVSDGIPLPAVVMKELTAHAWHRDFYR